MNTQAQQPNQPNQGGDICPRCQSPLDTCAECNTPRLCRVCERINQNLPRIIAETRETLAREDREACGELDLNFTPSPELRDFRSWNLSAGDNARLHGLGVALLAPPKPCPACGNQGGLTCRLCRAIPA